MRFLSMQRKGSGYRQRSRFVTGCFTLVSMEKKSAMPNVLENLFSLNRKKNPDDKPDDGLPLPPVAREVRRSEAVNLQAPETDTLVLQRGLTLLKGKVNSTNILGTSKTDLLPGKYEGGLKLWECTIDLIEAVRREMQDGHLQFRGKDILELGCGHGLPGIVACLKGAHRVHFQDFNEEVLVQLTIPNVDANLAVAREKAEALVKLADSDSLLVKSPVSNVETRFFAGDWADMGHFLSSAEPEAGSTLDLQSDSATEAAVTGEPPASETGAPCDGSAAVQPGPPQEPLGSTKADAGSSSRQGEGVSDGQEEEELSGDGQATPLAYHRKLAGTPSFYSRTEEEPVFGGGYDIILMSETVYSVQSLPKLLSLVLKCLRRPYGVVYVAGKKHYFGVGGGTRAFKSLVEEEGTLHSHLVTEVVDGSSNVREIWKFFFKN